MFETVVVDDLITIQEQNTVQETVMQQADWRFLTDVSGNENQRFPSSGFVHILKHPSYEKQSFLYNPLSAIFIPRLLTMGEFKEIYYNRIFLQLPLAPQFKKEHNGIHVDLPLEIPHIACVYYVNDSDGDTIIYEQTIRDTPGNSQGVNLKEHIRVTPKKGRAVFFDGSRYHCSSQPTMSYRAIINFDLTL